MRIVFCGAFAALFGISGLTHAVPVSGQGTWETTLLGRDINGHAVAITDPMAEFAFDKLLGGTWYLTGNNSGLNWSEAKNWAKGLTVGAFDGWSLPSIDDTCIGYNCASSQMGELYYTALGNLAFAANPLSNTGPFKNLLHEGYWLNKEYLDTQLAWYFQASIGVQVNNKLRPYSALAWRGGDVLVAVPVPEPGTYAMLLAGLVGVVMLTKSRHMWSRARYSACPQ